MVLTNSKDSAFSTSIYVPNAKQYDYTIDYIVITGGNELDASKFFCSANSGAAGEGGYISIGTWTAYNSVANKIVNCKITATKKS